MATKDKFVIGFDLVASDENLNDYSIQAILLIHVYEYTHMTECVIYVIRLFVSTILQHSSHGGQWTIMSLGHAETKGYQKSHTCIQCYNSFCIYFNWIISYNK